MHLAASSSKCLREGRLAQLVEHLVYTERVSGSSPLPPTILHCQFSRRQARQAAIMQAMARPSAASPRICMVALPVFLNLKRL